MDAILWAIPVLFIVAGMLVIVKIAMNGGKGIVVGIIGLAVMVIIIATTLIPAIEITSEESPNKTAYKWEYDDYYQIDGLESATGTLEVTSLGDTEYLHVFGIGEGTYVENGQTHTVTTIKAPLDVFVIGGQSNAQYNIWGTSELPDTNPVAKPGIAYYYGTDTHPLSTGNTSQASSYDATLYDIYMSVGSNGQNRLGNIEGPFSARYYDGVGNKVLTINTGVGGSSIASWVDGGICYTHAQDVFADAIDKVDQDYFEISVKSFLWIQGESNAYMPVNTYVADFNQLYNNITTYSFNPDYKLTYALISQTRDGKNAAVSQGILSDEPGIYMASTSANSFSIEDGTLRADGLHYSQKGDNILAKDFASLCIRLWR